MSTPRMMSLLQLNSPADEKIYVYEKNYKWNVLSIDEYNNQFNTHFLNGIVYDSKHESIIEKVKEQFPKEDTTTNSYRQLNAFLTNYKNYSFISYIDGTCGYGEIANQNIRANTIFGIYSSELIIRPKDTADIELNKRAYDMGLHLADDNNQKEQNYVKIKSDDRVIWYKVQFRAYQYGNLTRFALHAPSKERIKELAEQNYLPNIDASKILFANTSYFQHTYQNQPVRYYQAKFEIKKYSLILIDYGDGYWERRCPQAELITDNDNSNELETKTIGMPLLFMQSNIEPNIMHILAFDLKLKKYQMSENFVFLPCTDPVEKSKNSINITTTKRKEINENKESKYCSSQPTKYSKNNKPEPMSPPKSCFRMR